MTANQAPTRSRPHRLGPPSAALFGRVYLAAVITHLPILAVLLAPQGRSRISSESTAGLLNALLVGLVIAAVVLVPAVCARVAPAGPRWQPGNALAGVRALIRGDRRAWLRRLGELAALYTAAQLLGGLVAQIRPYIWENPRYGTEPGAALWEFHYANFALQGVTIYVAVCASTTWYACRLRQLLED
ncbi:hypothetical protein [Streptomyces flavochromogenes]|uniref:hypothetical protein n=1 Tax=Streptomyces flavochromogenes TaxID=68199 RepID=UPI0004C1260B|nr:hypothetical protein [Streptomyces flavochromogenes]